MKAPAINRTTALLTGLGLVTAGLAVGEWRFEILDAQPRTLSTGPVVDVLDAEWFSWAAGAAGLVLGLLGLWWLIAHLPKPPTKRVRLPASNSTGRLDIDIASIAPRLAADLERTAPVDRVVFQRVKDRREQLVRLRAHVDPRADAQSLLAAAGALRSQIEEAFPDGGLDVQILLDRPRRPSRRRTPRVH